MIFALKITDRDIDGSYFTAKFSAQGCYDCEIKGFLKHSFDDPDASTWEINNFGTVNGITHYPADEMLSLLGNGCMDIGNGLLDDMIKPYLETDFNQWNDWFEEDGRQAEREEILNNNFYLKQVGMS